MVEEEFPQYLPFVKRKQQVEDCVSHFAKAFAYTYGTESDHSEMTGHRNVNSRWFCYFCILLTSTRASEVQQGCTSSGVRTRAISLPLLTIDGMYEVVQHITKLCSDADASTPPAIGPIGQLILSNY